MTMRPTTKAIPLLAVVAMFAMTALAGCLSQPGTVSAFVRGGGSAPDYDGVYVTFTKVEVHAAGGDDEGDDEGFGDEQSDPFGTDDENETTDSGNETSGGNMTTGNETSGGNMTTGNDTSAETEDPFDDATDEFGSDEEGWTTVFESSTGETVNLLNYTTTEQAFLGQAEVDPGRYTQIRVTVSAAWGDQAGERVEFTVPSGELKTAKSFVIEDNETVALVIEIDLDQSIHEAGNSGQVIFRPVIGQVIVEYGSDATATTEAEPDPFGNDTAPEFPTGNETAPANETGNGSFPPS